jgi:hypothetical protein
MARLRTDCARLHGRAGQSRGSTHAHYFLWLKDAPDLSYLDEWVRETTTELFDGESAQLTEADVDRIVEVLNARALAGVGTDDGATADCTTCTCCGDGNDKDCQHRAAHNARWWAERCTRWNNGWKYEEPDNVHKGKPDLGSKGDLHPAERRHVPTPADKRYTSSSPVPDMRPEEWSYPPVSPDECVECVPAGMERELASIVNACNRHTKHTPYCQRRDPKTGKVYCRFHFPQTPPHVNRPHFYAERVKSGIRWRLALPMNDQLLNSVNPYQVLSQRSNCDFSPIIDHHSALEYMCKYASKAEKGSTASANLLNASLTKTERGDDERAVSVLTSVLAQQVGGRDWSAQEVAHVNMGLRTVWASHEFDHVTLGTHGKVKAKVSTLKDSERATQRSKWDLYLCRVKEAANQLKQNTLFHQGCGGAPGASVNNIDTDHVERCSFSEFWRRYHFVSAGRKGGRKLQLRVHPTIILVKPRMPRQWGKRGSAKRIDYCRVRLQCHKPFKDEAAYREYLFNDHKGDYEAAYEFFATSDEAPPCCKDDFREFDIEHDGEQVHDADAEAKPHPDFAFYQVHTAYAEASSRIKTSEINWGARSAEAYSADLIGSAARWSTSVAKSAVAPKPVQVDASKLNAGQAFIHRVVADHQARRSRGPVAPLRMLVCGTAGSGKTFLIRALKQQLGDACMVMAPTGVAADNIGVPAAVARVTRRAFDRTVRVSRAFRWVHVPLRRAPPAYEHRPRQHSVVERHCAIQADGAGLSWHLVRDHR